MWFRNDFAVSSARCVSAAIVLLLVHIFPTMAQVVGFDVFTAPDSPGSSIAAGSVYTIKWTPSNPAGKISIMLLEGTSDTSIQGGPIIANSIDSTAGSYAWQVPLDLPDFPVFAFQLYLVSDPTIFQYSYPFSISGLSATDSSGSSTFTSTATVAQAPSTLAASSSASSSLIALSTIPSSGSSSSTTISTTQPPTSTSPSPSPAPSNETLTTGAKAGIGIGASLGGILLFALIAFTFFRYGKRTAIKKSDADAGTWEKAELGIGRAENVELPAGSRDVLGIAELPERQRGIAELEAGARKGEGYGETTMMEIEKRG